VCEKGGGGMSKGLVAHGWVLVYVWVVMCLFDEWVIFEYVHVSARVV